MIGLHRTSSFISFVLLAPFHFAFAINKATNVICFLCCGTKYCESQKTIGRLCAEGSFLSAGIVHRSTNAFTYDACDRYQCKHYNNNNNDGDKKKQ